MDAKKLRAELIKRLRQSQAAMVLSMIAQQRIKARGSDIGGYPALWADTARIKVRRKKGKKTVVTEIGHYRAGGTPLYDTGDLFRSLHGVTQSSPNGARMILRGSMVALLQSKGFKTTGPNWIPFTRAAIKTHAAKGKKGKKRARGTYPTSNPDGLVVGKGVTVPPRPLFAFPPSAKQTVARAVAQALGAS